MDVSASQETSAPARSRAATRKRLIQAATALLADVGVHNITTHDIARDAGVASGTFYLYFRDKAEIHREILHWGLSELRRRTAEALENAKDPTSAQKARAGALVEFATDHRAVVRILFRKDSISGDPESDVLADVATNMAARLGRDQARGWFAPDLDPAITAQAILGMTARLIDWWTEDPDRATPQAIVQTLVRIQTSGTLPATQVEPAARASRIKEIT